MPECLARYRFPILDLRMALAISGISGGIAACSIGKEYRVIDAEEGARSDVRELPDRRLGGP